MISVSCNCGRNFSVADEHAGKSTKCPTCGNRITIPVPQVVSPSVFAESPAAKAVSPSNNSSVTVNVAGSGVANSLGIGSIVLGTLSLFVCWIPYVPIGFSGIGMALGIAGLIVSILRSGNGIGYAIAGMAINLVFGVFWIVVAFFIGAVFHTMNNIEIDPPKQAVPFESDSEFGEITEQNQESPSSTKGEPSWNSIESPLASGDISIKITSFKITNPEVNERFQSEKVKLEKMIVLRIEVTNTSKTKKIDYFGWNNSFSFGEKQKITDEFGNTYRHIGPDDNQSVAGTIDGTSLYPGKSFIEFLFFEKPVDDAKSFNILLGSPIISDHETEFRFMASGDQVKRE